MRLKTPNAFMEPRFFSAGVVMLRVDIRKARPGMTLALPVMNPKQAGQELLRVGYEMCPAIIEKLIEMGVVTLWVNYPSLSFLSKFVDKEAMRKQGHVVDQIRGAFETLQGESSAKLPYDTYTNAVSSLIDQIIGNPAAAFFLDDLCAHGSDKALLKQSSNVTYLALLMGLKLEGYLVKQRPNIDPERAKDVTNLGVGAMIHDLGVTLLPDEVVARFEETGDDTDPSWREHPTLGFRAVRGKLDPCAAGILLHHHQNYDGSGYAGKDFPAKQGDAIHIFARIVAVAQTYSRLRHPQNMKEQTAVWALNTMLSDGLRDRFDPFVLRSLFEVVPPYPPGSLVRLSDGTCAVVVEHHLADPCRPCVQMLDGDELPEADDEGGLGPIIELTKTNNTIIAIENTPTQAFNFDPEQIPGNRKVLQGW